jgi:hypothetical protein
MFCGMKLSGASLDPAKLSAPLLALFLCFSLAHPSGAQTSPTEVPASSQPQARRLILKDGSYQTVTKYEIQGNRVRYLSAERGEWEEVPKSLVDWDATGKFEQGRAQNNLAPEAVELDKQIEAERKTEQARSPEVAPGLRLPDEGGIFLLDTFDQQPQLAELQQSGGDIDKNTKTNILRAAINPLAGVKQTIELPDAHAKIQSHTTVPSVYINIDSNEGTAALATAQAEGEPPPLPLSERFKIIRVDVKDGKRTAGAIKIGVTGKMKTDERFISATVAAMTGGWVKLTPTEPLANGEYAVAEMLGKEGMNLYVWDFGVNPAAAPNAFTWKPDQAETQPKKDPPPDLQKREKQ